MIQEARAEDRRLEELRAAGQGWSDEAQAPPPARAGVTSELVVVKEVAGSHPGDRYVRVIRAGKGTFRGAGPGTVRATAAVPRARGQLGRLVFRAKEWVVGDPLANEQSSHERLTKVKALAVLSSDAISS